MPWSPLFEESTESEIVSKMMAVIHRDMKAALDYWYLSDNLPDFAVMTEGPQDQFSYPLLVIVVQEGSSEETTSGEWLDQEIGVHLAFGIKGVTIKAVRSRARKYMRALRAILRKSVLELLPAGSDYLDYSISFRWRYLKQGTKDTDVIQEAEMLMRLKFGET